LTGASTVTGDTSFENIDGEIETGHSGNGYIKITTITGGIFEEISQTNWIFENI
jgi:hypothetical protein